MVHRDNRTRHCSLRLSRTLTYMDQADFACVMTSSPSQHQTLTNLYQYFPIKMMFTLASTAYLVSIALAQHLANVPLCGQACILVHKQAASLQCGSRQDQQEGICLNTDFYGRTQDCAWLCSPDTFEKVAAYLDEYCEVLPTTDERLARTLHHRQQTVPSHERIPGHPTTSQHPQNPPPASSSSSYTTTSHSSV